MATSQGTGKQEHTKAKIIRKREIVNIRAETNEMEIFKNIYIYIKDQRNKIKLILQKYKQETKPQQTKRREEFQRNKIRDEKENTATDTTEIQKIIRHDHEKLHAIRKIRKEKKNKGFPNWKKKESNHQQMTWTDIQKTLKTIRIKK